LEVAVTGNLQLVSVAYPRESREYDAIISAYIAEKSETQKINVAEPLLFAAAQGACITSQSRQENSGRRTPSACAGNTKSCAELIESLFCNEEKREYIVYMQ
jgi:hypothetical protein